jgi:PAS domain S-box-containing protein
MFRPAQILSSDGFMPHGMCYLWQPGVLGLHIASDLLITLSYFSIPFTLLYFVRRRRDLEFDWMFVCFAVFIVACGLTHLMEIVVVWHPLYWLSGGIKALTALASVPTAILLAKLIPTALTLPSPAALRAANAALEREIAEHKRTEGELRVANEALRSEATQSRLAAIVESSDDAIIGKTRAGIINSWNRGATQIFGYTEAEAIGCPTTILFPPGLLAEETEILDRIGRGEQVPSFETVRVRKDGTLVDISATISPTRDSDGKIVGSSKIARDITERKQAEQKLAAQLARLHLLNGITRAIAERHDLASIFQVVVNTLEEQLPIDFGCICRYEAPDTHLAVTRLGGHSLELATRLGFAEHTRIEIDHNGLSRCVAGDLVHEPCLQEVPFPFLQKLCAGGLGALVAAPLLVESNVFGVLIAARQEAHSFSSGEARDRMLIVKRAIEGVAHTVARMKEFYSQRDSQSTYTPVNLNHVIEQVIELTRARWSTIPQKSGVVVQVETFLAAQLPNILGQESDLCDAFTNLLLNAVDAMPDGGRLTFRSRMIDSRCCGDHVDRVGPSPAGGPGFTTSCRPRAR